MQYLLFTSSLTAAARASALVIFCATCATYKAIKLITLNTFIFTNLVFSYYNRKNDLVWKWLKLIMLGRQILRVAMIDQKNKLCDSIAAIKSICEYYKDSLKFNQSMIEKRQIKFHFIAMIWQYMKYVINIISNFVVISWTF